MCAPSRRGRRSSRAPRVNVILQIWRSNLLFETYTFPNVLLADIAAGGSVSTYLDTIPVDRSVDNDIVAIISVDSPTAALPQGAIRESNESDNIATRTCRVYAFVNPDTSVRGCN